MVAHGGEVARQVLGRRVAVLRVLHEAALDDPAQGRRRLRVRLGDRLRVLAHDRDERLGAGLALEGALARRHLVEDRAEGELVGAEIDRPSGGLLRRHVAGRAHHGARLRRRSRRRLHDRRFLRERLDELGEAEVEDLDVPVLRDHDVLGLQVPVDDARAVRLGEALGDLRGEVEELARRNGLRGDELAQRAPLDQLHRDVRRFAGCADVVDRQDVRVVQRRGRPRLLLEAPPPLGIRGALGGQDLDRDVAAEPLVPRAVDLAHPSRAERREDLVGAELRSVCERHPIGRHSTSARHARRPGSPGPLISSPAAEGKHDVEASLVRSRGSEPRARGDGAVGRPRETRRGKEGREEVGRRQPALPDAGRGEDRHGRGDVDEPRRVPRRERDRLRPAGRHLLRGRSAAARRAP